LLRNLVGEIRRRYPVAAEGTPQQTSLPESGEAEKTKPNDSEIPFEYNPLINAFHEALKRPTAEQPLFIFLDALDQLTATHNAHSLAWLPSSLNSNVRLIVSAALPAEPSGDLTPSLSHPMGEGGRRPGEGDSIRDTRPSSLSPDPRAAIMSALTSRLDAGQRVTLPPLTVADGEQMLTNCLADAHCTLQPAQRKAILETFQAEGSPLWLRTAAEEAARLASWQPAPSFAPTTPGLLGQVLDRLSREEEHGDKLVSRTLSYLACARHGLAEDEILDILSADKEVMADFRRRSPNSPPVDSLPVAVWVRLHGDLAFYLAEHQAQGASLLGFYHRSFLEAVTAHSFALRDARETRHQHMSGYFLDCAKGLDPAKEWETDAERGFAECVFHLVKAGQHEQAAALVSNFPFLLHKLRVGLLQGVFEDYEMLRCEAPAEVVKRLEIWAAFFRERAHILRRGNEEWPAHKILLQLAVEHADDSPLTIGAERWLTEGRCDWLWLRRVPRLSHTQSEPCLKVLEGHNGSITGALALVNGRLLSWSSDKTLRLWDAQSGACMAVLEGHTRSVEGALALTDGRLLSWTDHGIPSDCTLRLWDGRDGVCLAVLEGHTDCITGAMALADRRLLSWSWDNTLRIWDAQSGSCLVVLEGHTSWAEGALALADGRLLSWSWDKTLRLWDGRSGACLKVFEGHTESVIGALALADGRLLSWSSDKTLRLWDAQSGSCLAVLEGHTRSVEGALALADGRLLSWTNQGERSDYTLRLWDGWSGACLKVFEGHTDSITGALALADGRLLSWSSDKTLRLWDAQSGSCLAVLEGHTASLTGALALTDGRLLSWAWDMTLRVWDSDSGACLAVLKGHSDCVQGALALADERILSWSHDDTLRLWDWQSGDRLAATESRNPRLQWLQTLTNGQLMSCSKDDKLCLWDAQSGDCLTVLAGHTGSVAGALALADRRLLSWSWDKTLRLWDAQSGQCLAVLKGHSSSVEGALVLADGRILSWSEDKSLRLWNGQSGACLAVFEGHTDDVRGALALVDGRLLSWSWDKTLRLWNSQSGSCLAVLEGHTRPLEGALELADGRLLSWAWDKTLRLWDVSSGACLAVLEGHTEEVQDALELADGRLLSWAKDKSLRLWDSQHGICLETVLGDAVAGRHPDWLNERNKAEQPNHIFLDFRLQRSDRGANLRHKIIPVIVCAWNLDSATHGVHYLLSDGTAVVTQQNGQVCILKLYQDNRRVTLAEAEEILAPQMKKAECHVSSP